MRLDTWTRQRYAEIGFFVIFVNGAEPRSRKSHQQKEDADSLIIDKAIYKVEILFFPIFCRIPKFRSYRYACIENVPVNSHKVILGVHLGHSGF